MGRFGRAFFGLLVGYVIGAVVGGGLVLLASTNTHDTSIELAMTAFFAGGPLGAVLGVVVALLWSRKP